MTDWTLRKAIPSDAEALSACLEAAYAQYRDHIADLPPVSANCAEEIARHQVWVAECQGSVVGALVVIPEEGFLRLANLAVVPRQRGTGLGRALMTLAETEAREQGFAEMRLTTHASHAGEPRALPAPRMGAGGAPRQQGFHEEVALKRGRSRRLAWASEANPAVPLNS